MQCSLLTIFLFSAMDQVKMIHYSIHFLRKTQLLLQWRKFTSVVSVFANPSNSYYHLTQRVFNVDDDISFQFFFMKRIYAAECLFAF